MTKILLALVAAAVVLGTFLAPALIARQQAVTRFEYLRVAPYGGMVQERGQTMLVTFLGYRRASPAEPIGCAAISRRPIRTRSEMSS